ncbi:mechanosensitive ion channel [Candidatus Thorarchaeota archaeon]|nr:MAG: mechanosensitive ion channel [Candidatus Thorarchaeota archaeon]
MQDIYTSFVDFIRLLLEPFGLDTYAQNFAQIIVTIPLLILLYIVYLIVMRAVTLSFRKAGMPVEARSSVRMMLRLLFLGIALSLILGATNLIDSTAIVTGGALFGTAIGLAFSKALSNIVSGFYVLGARPFRVGDYVKIGDIEGIVTEITLNYTRLLLADYTREFVPNGKVVDSQVTNYRIRIDDYMEERGREYQNDTPKANLVRTAFSSLRELAKGTEVFRYSFELNVHKDYDISLVHAYFDQICEKWKDEFVDKPEVLFSAEVMFGLVYKVVYIVKDPMEILGKGSDFTHEISRFHFVAKAC